MGLETFDMVEGLRNQLNNIFCCVGWFHEFYYHVYGNPNLCQEPLFNDQDGRGFEWFMQLPTMTTLFEGHPFSQEHIIFNLMNLYVEIEFIRSHTQIYDKFNNTP